MVGGSLGSLCLPVDKTTNGAWRTLFMRQPFAGPDVRMRRGYEFLPGISNRDKRAGAGEILVLASLSALRAQKAMKIVQVAPGFNPAVQFQDFGKGEDGNITNGGLPGNTPVRHRPVSRRRCDPAAGASLRQQEPMGGVDGVDDARSSLTCRFGSPISGLTHLCWRDASSAVNYKDSSREANHG